LKSGYIPQEVQLISQNMQFDNILSLRFEAGKNYIKDKRVLIQNTAAIGNLRKELICTLGMEQAKGFLIRYGFASGYHDASIFMRDFPLDDKAKSYRLGVLIHTFVGMAHVAPLESQYDEDNGEWHCEGYWLNSYEAEHHLKHFGPAEEPVCWSLMGYASGIMSAFFGEQVIIKEISCVASGDKHCRYVGKTLAQWGDEILPDLRYYQKINLDKALEQAYDKIHEQNELLKQSVAIHEQINRMVLNGGELPAIASAVGQIIGGTILVEDQFFRPVAYFSPKKSTGGELLTQANCSARDIFNNWRYSHLAATLNQGKKAVLLTPESTRKPFARLISPVTIGHSILGYVNAFKTSGEFTSLDRMTLDHAVTVFALKMMQTRAVAEAENRLKGDFVEDLIMGNFSSENLIIERASYLGYNLSQFHYVLVVEVDNFSRLIKNFMLDEKQLQRFKDHLCETVNLALNACNLNGIVTSKGNHVIVIAALDANTVYTGTDLARAIKARVNRRFLEQKITVSIGIGRICHAPSDFALSYQEAQRAITVIKGLNQNDTVLSFDSLGAYGLLFHNADQQDLLAFMERQLGKLLKYDARHQTQLVDSLHLYFRYDGSIKEAASAAAVTPSAFKYRLKKACEIGGFTLKEPDKKFDLQMALKIWCIINTGKQ